MKLKQTKRMLIACLLCLLSINTQAVQINGARITQTDNDNDEYFELKGDLNESSKESTYLVTTDGDTGILSDPVGTRRTIPEIQSDGALSPFRDERVITRGVVTVNFQAEDYPRGFFMQDATGDGNPLTSDGIFVFTPEGYDVSTGDEVEVAAEIDDRIDSSTQLIRLTSLSVLSTGNTISPTQVTLPEATDGELGRYEGMLVEVVSPMTISQISALGRFGQMTLASPDDNGNMGRLFQPTNLYPIASQERAALADSNARRFLALDDGRFIIRNDETVPYIGKPPRVIRSGDQVSNLVGVLDYGLIYADNFESTVKPDYRLHPIEAPVFTSHNLREEIPQSTGGTLSIASYNVQNYFTTIDSNRRICGPNTDQKCPGADSESELARQQAKIVSTLKAMDADVVGLVDIENNGYAKNSAITTLVNAVNAAYGTTEYNFIAPEGLTILGEDITTVGFIYKPSMVTPTGTVATLSTGSFFQKMTTKHSRQPLAVTFEEIATTEQFTVVINDFKSRRQTPYGDFDRGQGVGNPRRIRAANELAAWLATNPTGVDDPDVLIMGDLNAYAEEDPMLALQTQGYIDLIQQFNHSNAYSHIAGGLAGSLTQALSTDTLAEQVTGVIEWHINTDEPELLDYNEDKKPQGYYIDNPFRSSDRDPVIVGLSLLSEKTDRPDSDSDGVNDDHDLCPASPADKKANTEGCTGAQFVELKCEHHFPDLPYNYNNDRPFVYLNCVSQALREAFLQELLSASEVTLIAMQARNRVLDIL